MKHTIKQHIIIFIVFCASSWTCFSQQLPQFTQFIFNTISINPAYAGTREKLTAAFLNRNQWVGIDGGPVTQTFTADTSIPYSNLGVGLSVINDQLGFEKITYAYADGSYSISLNDTYRLSFGLKAGATRYNIDSELLTDPEAIGDRFLERSFNRWEPNFGAGVYLRSDSWFIAFSAPRVINYNSNNSNAEFLGIERVSYYVNGGSLININPSLGFRPTFLAKFTNGAPPSLDLTANFLINEKFWLGASYRIADGFGGLATFQATKNLRVGYAYEYSTTSIRQFTSGSHEVFVTYQFDLFRPVSKCNCPNKF